MDETLIVIGVLFLFGLFQGLTVCNLTCGSLLFLRLAGRGRGAKEGFTISLLFALPRMIILTSLGALLGGLGYTISIPSTMPESAPFKAAIYIIIGLVMVVTGLVFMGILRGREHMGKPGLKNRLFIFLMKLGPRKRRGEGRTMFGIGLLISLVCFVKASAASLFVASLLGIDAGDVGRGFLYGTLAMLAYSIGLTLPLLLLGTGASAIGKRLKGKDARVVGGILLLIIGSLIVLFEILFLITM